MLMKQGSFSLQQPKRRSTTLKAKLRKQGSISNMRDPSKTSLKDQTSGNQSGADISQKSRPTPVTEKKETKLPEIKNLAKFQAMVYNRNYILNIDNQIATTRNNQKYVSGYYERGVTDKIGPATTRSYHTLDSPLLKSNAHELKQQLS